MEPEQPTPKPPTSAQTVPAQPPLPVSVNYEAFYKVRSTPRLLLLPGAIGAVSFVTLMIMAALQSASSHQSFDMDSEMPHGGLIILAIMVVIASIALYAWRQTKRLEAAYRQFLADNRWSEITDPSTDDVATSMLGIGRSPEIHDAFNGTYKGMPFRAVRYEYTTGSGRSQKTHYFVDLHFDLKQTFPLIVLDNKESEYFKFIDDLPRIPNSQQLQLEGDFNDKYKVSVMSGTEQEVLQVLTPDFMAELMNDTLKVDVELEANKLYIIKHGPTNWTASDLQALFAMADVMTKNLGELAGTWQASSSTSTVTEMAGTALIARQQAMLRPHHIIGVGGLIALAIYLLGMLLGSGLHH